MISWIRRLLFGTPEAPAPAREPFRLADAKALFNESALAAEQNARQPWEATGDISLDLVMFAAEGALEKVDRLLASGASPNARAPDTRLLVGPPPGGLPALHAASRRGHADVVVRLLHAGGEINMRDQVGNTALSEAAASGHSDLVGVLLAAGAEVDPKGAYYSAMPPVLTPGYTPLMLAVKAGHLEAVQVLLAAGADPNVKADLGSTSLVDAAEESAEIVRCLLDAGADVNVRLDDGSTALIAAALMGNVDTTRALIDGGADVNLRDDEGKTAGHCAAEEGYVEILALLLDAGLDVRAQDHQARTAIQASEPWPEAHRYLLTRSGAEQ